MFGTGAMLPGVTRRGFCVVPAAVSLSVTEQRCYPEGAGSEQPAAAWGSVRSVTAARQRLR